MSERPRFPESLHDLRIWAPSAWPKKADARFYEKPVRVVWLSPHFEVVGYVPKFPGSPDREPVWESRWFGYVVELGRAVPSSELLPNPNGKKAPHA